MSLKSNRPVRLVVLCALSMALLLAASPGWSQEESKTLDPRVANDLLDAYEMINEDDHESALDALNELMAERGEDMKDFDRATTLQIRGTAHINLDNVNEALDDFSAALRLNALPPEQQNRLRFNIAQLYFITERYEESLEFFEEWLAQEDVEITHNTYFMLAAANYNLENYRESLEPIDNAIETAPEPEQRYYDLKNSAMSQLGMVDERIELLEEIISIWPEKLPYWRQLSALYMERGEDYKAFSTIEAAYVNGLIEDEDDIVLLAQYYSTFNNPHRGAQLLEREMEAGNVERNQDHLEMLSQLWSQAREHRKAIPILREAARMAETGTLFYRLGQALMATERNEAAEQAFENAIERGGLNDRRLAEAWLLLGNARFNQAEPGDRDQRMIADEAFARAERFDNTRSEASNWRRYIKAINETESRQAMLENEQQERLADAARDRRLTACRAQQLAGSTLTEECRALLAEEEERQQEEREQQSEEAQSESQPE